MRPTRSLAIIACLALLAGCATTPKPPDEAQEIADMLLHYDYLATLKAEEQRRELIAAQLLHERAPNDTTRLSLALVLLLPHAPWHDDIRAQVLLGNIKPHSARHGLAQILLKLITECQREQREERRKVEEIQQKLDALRAIDKDLGLRRKTP